MILAKNEYNQWSLFIGNNRVSNCMSSGVTRSKKDEQKCTELGYYRICYANFGPTDANCEFNTLNVITGSVKTFLPSRSLIEDLSCIALELFLLLFTKEFILCQIYFASLRLAAKKRRQKMKRFTYSRS